MKMNNSLGRLVLLAAIALLLNRAAIAQSRATHQGCSLATFDAELRSAMRSGDAERTALLVNYPLRVNDGRGTYYVKDAASLQGRFKDIFTPAVKTAVTSQQLGPMECNIDRFMYGNGEVWVSSSPHGYAVSSVNVTDSAELEKRGRMEFSCRSDEYRAIVDNDSTGKLRLRLWGKGRLLFEKPDSELLNGKKNIEGTGACSHQVWTFNSAANDFVVEELGCYPDSNQPPPAAIGQLSKQAASKHDWWWCF